MKHKIKEILENNQKYLTISCKSKYIYVLIVAYSFDANKKKNVSLESNFAGIST